MTGAGTLEDLLLFVVAAPAAAFFLLSLCWLLGIGLAERTIARLTAITFLAATVACAWLGWGLFSNNLAAVKLDFGDWIRAGNYEFPLTLIADHLSWPLLALTTVLTGLVGLFSVRYMHREKGFLRFFTLLHLFAAGSLLVFAAGSFDLLVAGWELVGITSVLLVAFFQHRPTPVQNAMHIFAVYRTGDIGLLVGIFVLHYMGGTAQLAELFPGDWPTQGAHLGPVAAAITGLLFLFAASAKSSQLPFFGWLPRAMEGPTPSSAIFYGAISVHMGAYLLLRIQPLLAAVPVAAAATIAVGLISATVATLAHRVVPDAKSSIAYAALTQVGIIFAEIGLGFPRLALLHIGSHAAVRTLQFLRAPSMLHDYHRVHAASGGELDGTGEHFRHLPRGFQLWAYRFAIDRGFYEAAGSRLVVGPMMSLSRWLGRLEPGQAPVTRSDEEDAYGPTPVAEEQMGKGKI
jgi:NAD(P)H-quinone oxidoreductase subunit 5